MTTTRPPRAHRARAMLGVSILSVILSLAAVLAAGQPASAAPRGGTRVVAHCDALKQLPRHVVMTCADGNASVTFRHYDSWNRRAAWGSGSFHINWCRPDCASSRIRSYPATFRLFRPVQTARGKVFSRIGITYLRGGRQHDITFRLPTRPL